MKDKFQQVSLFKVDLFRIITSPDRYGFQAILLGIFFVKAQKNRACFTTDPKHTY